jgi:hypothetical protein
MPKGVICVFVVVVVGGACSKGRACGKRDEQESIKERVQLAG